MGCAPSVHDAPGGVAPAGAAAKPESAGRAPPASIDDAELAEMKAALAEKRQREDAELAEMKALLAEKRQRQAEETRLSAEAEKKKEIVMCSSQHIDLKALLCSSQPMHAPFRALSANALLFKTLKNSNTQLHRYTSTRLFSTTPSNPSALVDCNTSTRLFYIQ